MSPRPDADAYSEVEAAAAQSGASQASQQDNATGGQQVRASGYEGSFKQNSDIGTEEALAAGVAFGANQSPHLRAKLDEIHANHVATVLADEREHKANLRAVALDRLSSLNTTSKLGDDRMWNVNETDAYAAIMADAIARRLAESDD